MNGQIVHTLNGPFKIDSGDTVCAWSGYPDGPTTHYDYVNQEDNFNPKYCKVYLGHDLQNEFIKAKYNISEDDDLKLVDILIGLNIICIANPETVQPSK